MRQQRVSLHLSEPDPSGPLATLYRLVGENVYGACGADLELVGHHVTQPLVVDHTHKDVRLKLPPIHATVESLVAIVIVASYKE